MGCPEHPGAPNGADPQRIYVRLENVICFTTASFLLTTENCAPTIPQGFSPSGDGINDEFEITGLVNVFDDFTLLIYSRQGNLIYEGTNEIQRIVIAANIFRPEGVRIAP